MSFFCSVFILLGIGVSTGKRLSHSFILFTPVIKITVRNKCSVFPCSFARGALCLGKVAIYSVVRGALSIYQVILEVLMGCNWYISFGRSTEKSREHYFGTLKKLVLFSR